MKIAYLDCFSGISGDMFLGALVHAGVTPEWLRGELARLGLSGFSLEVERTWRDAMEGVRVEVRLDSRVAQPHRRLADIKNILAGSALDPEIKDRATAVFTALARAEARVHGTTEEEVHFHEVGAVDAIVDIVGTVAGLRWLGIDKVYCSTVTLGQGFAQCAHGQMPVPVPASIELLKGRPVQFSTLSGELVTPTGAALLSTCAEPGDMPSFVPLAIGYGFGSRTRESGPPNALRLIVGEVPAALESVVVLETNLDDETGQVIGFLIERALEAGALDAWAVPIQMKKSRPGVLFAALVDESRADAIEALIFRETHTLGVRRHRAARARLERRIETIDTSLGRVRAKFARGAAGPRVAAEFEDVSRIARERGMAYRDALLAVQRELPVWPEEQT